MNFCSAPFSIIVISSFYFLKCNFFIVALMWNLKFKSIRKQWAKIGSSENGVRVNQRGEGEQVVVDRE